MPEFFSSDGNVVLQFLAIFSVIVVVMGAIYLIYRRFAGRGLSLSARAGNRARQPRLGIVDIYELDRQRQLILLRRDNVEHLLLVGGPNDVVVERNVQRGGAARVPGDAPVRSDSAHDDLFAGGPSDPQPNFEMPVVVPQPLPGSDRQPDPVVPRLDPSLFDPEVDDAKTGDAQTARGRAGRILRRTPPPLVNLRPDAAATRMPAASPPSAAAEGQVPPILPSGTTRSVDPAILSDMARQLEVALRRQSSAVTPPPGQAAGPDVAQAAPAPPAPPPEPVQAAPAAEPRRVANPVAAGMAASQVLNPPPPRQRPAVPPPAKAPTATPVADPEPSPAPSSENAVAPPPETPPVAPAPAPAPAPASAPKAAPPIPPAKPAPQTAKPAPPAVEPAAATPAPAAEKPEPAAAANPFSVEEIEAEFARLLGRPLDKKS